MKEQQVPYCLLERLSDVRCASIASADTISRMATELMELRRAGGNERTER